MGVPLRGGGMMIYLCSLSLSSSPLCENTGHLPIVEKLLGRDRSVHTVANDVATVVAVTRRAEVGRNAHLKRGTAAKTHTGRVVVVILDDREAAWLQGVHHHVRSRHLGILDALADGEVRRGRTVAAVLAVAPLRDPVLNRIALEVSVAVARVARQRVSADLMAALVVGEGVALEAGPRRIAKAVERDAEAGARILVARARVERLRAAISRAAGAVAACDVEIRAGRDAASGGDHDRDHEE